MFNFLIRIKKDKKEKEESKEVEIVRQPQNNKNNIYIGMYCNVCGYMFVDENDAALPLEGFAICPNCGAPLKRGTFMKCNDGTFALSENAQVILSGKTTKQTGGHYRVRKAGPLRSRHHDAVKKKHAIR